MRAFDILSMVIVTKLLRSNASATPPNYSASNLPSLIGDDTNEDTRALRVRIESDIQEERNNMHIPSTFNFDTLMAYVPGTAAHGAANAAKTHQLTLAKMGISEEVAKKWSQDLQTNEKFKWGELAALLHKDIDPSDLRIVLSKYENSEDEINSILLSYTTFRQEFKASNPNLTMKDVPLEVVYDAAQAFRAEQHVLTKMDMSKDEVNKWFQDLQTNEKFKWGELAALLHKGIDPSDLRIVLSKYENSEDEINSILLSYTTFRQEFEARNPDLSMKDVPLEVVYDAAQAFRALEAARAEKHVLTKLEMSEEVAKKWSQDLQTDEKFKWGELAALLHKGIDPSDLRIVLSKYENSEDEINSILLSYTTFRQEFKGSYPKLSMEDVPLAAAFKAAQAFRAQIGKEN